MLGQTPGGQRRRGPLKEGLEPGQATRVLVGDERKAQMAKCRMKIPGSLLLCSLPAAEAERNPTHRVLTRHSHTRSSLTPPGQFPGRKRNRVSPWKKSVRCAELFPVPVTTLAERRAAGRTWRAEISRASFSSKELGSERPRRRRRTGGSTQEERFRGGGRWLAPPPPRTPLCCPLESDR